MQMKVIFGAGYPRSRYFRWPKEPLLPHCCLTSLCQGASTEGLSRHGEEQESNLGHDMQSMACRASERCHFRKSAWLSTLCQGE